MTNHRGKLAILTIFAIAAGASFSAIAYMRHQSRRAVAYWGVEAGELILNSPRVTVRRLTGSGDQSTQLAEGEERNVEAARGFINLRRGLMIDASFDWDAPPAGQVSWQYAMTFEPLPAAPAAQAVTLLFAPASQAAALRTGDGPPRPISTVPINKGLTDFFAEQFAETQPK